MFTHSYPARFALAAMLAAGSMTGQTSAAEMSRGVEHMATEAQQARPIEGALATLDITEKGVWMSMHTAELTPGHVTTAWWVIMTNAQACSQTPCTAEDVIGRAADVGTQIVYADGVVNAPDGSASFASYLPAGQVERGWYEQDFSDPTTAEIHLVLNDHGPLIPEIAASMLMSYRGGCSDDSLPPPFPEKAKADGVAGPNQCRLIQDAIFVQSK